MVEENGGREGKGETCSGIHWTVQAPPSTNLSPGPGAVGVKSVADTRWRAKRAKGSSRRDIIMRLNLDQQG